MRTLYNTTKEIIKFSFSIISTIIIDNQIIADEFNNLFVRNIILSTKNSIP